MIWLTEEDRRLLAEMEGEISKERMRENWGRFVEHTPVHSGSPEEEAAVQFLKEKLEEYGLEPEILRFDAYISDPKWAKLEILQPLEMEIPCTPYRQVGTTGSESWTMDRDVTRVETTYKVELKDALAQKLLETIRLEVEDRGRRLALEESMETRMFFPQEFIALVELNGKFEFLGWFERDSTRTLTKASPDNIALLRRR